MGIKRHKPEEIVTKLRQVEVLCGQGMPRVDAIRQVQITEQTFYRWRKQCGGMGTDQLPELKRLQKENDRLRRENRILKEESGISVVRIRKHKVTTDSDHKFNIAPNLLDRNFAAELPNQKWAGDISYVWTREGWLYLAVILDLHSRRIIGWAVSTRMKRDLAIRTLNMAIAFRAPPKGCIHHTDRGAQYCSHDYQKILRQHGFSVSMSGKGNCYDNAAVETIKAEPVWRRS